jgi:hypothetical protein
VALLCVQGDCSATDPYADYEGTLRGVMDGGCDIAFTKHTVPMQYAKDGSEPAQWATKNKVGASGLGFNKWQSTGCPAL